jgi:hypothetical protein
LIDEPNETSPFWGEGQVAPVARLMAKLLRHQGCHATFLHCVDEPRPKCSQHGAFIHWPVFFSSENEMARIDSSMTNQSDYFLLGHVARTLGCKPYQIVYLLTTGQVPEPRRLGNRRLFKSDDVRRIAVKLGIKQQVGGEAKCAKNFAQ